MINGEPNWTKADWREAAKTVRAPMRVDDYTKMIDAIFNDILKKTKADIVSVYWPVVGELDTRPLIDALLEKDVTVALPRVVAGRRDLSFHSWKKDDDLETGAFGLMEPTSDPATLCTPDVVFVPMLAFDKTGHRLGYGKGHYDATLAHGKGTFIGLAYAEQQTAHPLPIEGHDVKLDGVLTPQGMIWFK